jgi:hypothetical protein
MLRRLLDWSTPVCFFMPSSLKHLRTENKEGLKCLGCSCLVPIKLFVCATLQRQNTEISKQIFPEKEYRGLSPSFHIHASVSDLNIPTFGLPILLEEIHVCRPILGLYKGDFRCSAFRDRTYLKF